MCVLDSVRVCFLITNAAPYPVSLSVPAAISKPSPPTFLLSFFLQFCVCAWCTPLPHCPSLLHHPSRHASLPFTPPIIFSSFSTTFFLDKTIKNNTAGCCGLSLATPNISVKCDWLAKVSGRFGLVVSSRWGAAVPLNQCPAVGRGKCQTQGSSGGSCQHWQLSTKTSPGDGHDLQTDSIRVENTTWASLLFVFHYRLKMAANQPHPKDSLFQQVTKRRKVISNSKLLYLVRKCPHSDQRVTWQHVMYAKVVESLLLHTYFKCYACKTALKHWLKTTHVFTCVDWQFWGFLNWDFYCNYMYWCCVSCIIFSCLCQCVLFLPALGLQI